jgi:predicted dehydrogenase
MKNSRRAFIRNSVGSLAALSVGGILPGFSAKAYSQIIGANDRIRVAVMGVNSRGFALATNFAKQENAVVSHIADVDTRAAAKCAAAVNGIQQDKTKEIKDFRKALEAKEADVLAIAAPDHWHAPAAILASAAGKHVYVEKPCSHNPHEGELLLAAAAKYKNKIQMGNQRRSWPNVAAAIKEIHDGAIGRAYFAKTWYTNNRAAIGNGKKVDVPSWLDYELWQGPAPRKAYRDNIIHYNWHWFWNWGTGEACNNGTHMVDLARWGLEVNYPVEVSSSGGRYRYQDDWQTPDTQVINLEFENRKMISWEGRSCNGKLIEGSGAGIQFFGDNGSMLIDGNAYKIFNSKDELIKEVKDVAIVDPRNLSNPSESLDALHLQNFFNAIRKGTPLQSDIVGGHQSTLLCQLGNIALRSGSTLKTDPRNGHILNNESAKKYWSREYAKGWEPKV